MLAVGQFSKVTIIDLKTNSIAHSMTRIAGRILELSFDPLGDFVALGTASGRVVVWNLKGTPEAGKDSLLALEEYPGGSSPITELIIHPLGRIMFAAERKGRVNLWRLLRTDFQMGLRDPDAKIDKKPIQGQVKRIIQLQVEINSGFLSDEGQILNLVLSDGTVRNWKIRGMAPLDILEKGSTISLAELDPSSDGKLLASALRTQKIEFWCRNSNETLLQTPVFKEPISLLASSSEGPILWVAQKTGNLSSFDSRTVSSGCKI